jgi:hypothetical protein
VPAFSRKRSDAIGDNDNMAISNNAFKGAGSDSVIEF